MAMSEKTKQVVMIIFGIIALAALGLSIWALINTFSNKSDIDDATDERTVLENNIAAASSEIAAASSERTVLENNIATASSERTVLETNIATASSERAVLENHTASNLWLISDLHTNELTFEDPTFSFDDAVAEKYPDGFVASSVLGPAPVLVTP